MKKFLILILGVLISASAYAQGCSTCTATAANLDPGSANSLNMGIVYLAFIPLAFMITVGIIWYRKTRSAG